MSDMMEFPQTVDEFMEQYKVVDTDHIYSNGTVYVPIFRMKQWFDHVESENDRVKVVLCKDCRYYINSNEKCGLIDTRLQFYNTGKRWTEDCFCSWGEVKNDE